MACTNVTESDPYAFKLASKVEPKVLKNTTWTKKATSFLIAICYTLTTFGFPRTIQKGPRIVKENGQTTTSLLIPLGDKRHKKASLPAPIFINFQVFLKLWPQRKSPVLHKVIKRTSNRSPEGATSCLAEAWRAPQGAPGVTLPVATCWLQRET